MLGGGYELPERRVFDLQALNSARLAPCRRIALLGAILAPLLEVWCVQASRSEQNCFALWFVIQVAESFWKVRGTYMIFWVRSTVILFYVYNYLCLLIVQREP